MTNTFKISADDIKAIREYAEETGRRESSCARFTLFLGERYNTDDETIQSHWNVALVSNLPDWCDTDLYDNSIPWATLRGPIPATDDGRAVFDIWIYERGLPSEGHGELLNQCQAYFQNGRLVRLEANGEHVKTLETAASDESSPDGDNATATDEPAASDADKSDSTTYRLGSAGFVHAPGLIAWAMNGYAFKKDRARLETIVSDTWRLPISATRALLTGTVPFKVEDSAVVFTF